MLHICYIVRHQQLTNRHLACCKTVLATKRADMPGGAKIGSKSLEKFQDLSFLKRLVVKISVRFKDFEVF